MKAVAVGRKVRKIRNLKDEGRKARARKLIEKIGSKGMYPLNAPGMPPPGPDFFNKAIALGDDSKFEKKTAKRVGLYEPGAILNDLYLRALREPGFTLDVKRNESSVETVSFVPGHIWGQWAEEWQRSLGEVGYDPPPVDGPHPARVMVLGKMPWMEEAQHQRNLVGPSGEVLTSLIKKLHIKGAREWYLTNLVKFIPPGETTQLKAGWIHDCMPLLHQELRIVRPDYILCLGADASKWLLGKKFNVSYMAGRVIPYSFPVHLAENDEPRIHTSHVMTVLHPVEVTRSPEKIRILESNFGRFAYLLTGADFSLEEKDLDHRACYSLEEAESWVDEVEAELSQVPKKNRLIGIDLEWEGQHPVNKGTYVRTIQISWAPKKSICFVIHEAGGKKKAFRDRDGFPAIKKLVKLLNRFMIGKRAVGHFLVSDLEWAHSIGFYPTGDCPVPLFPSKKGKLAWERVRDGEGWLDTAYMNHAIEETAPLGLETLAMRFTTAPRYDIPLEDWKKAYCAEKKLKGEALEGYGECPDDIIIPYGNYDADVTLRIAISLQGLLDTDFEGNCAWEPFWESMIAQGWILDIHKNGICVDREQIDEQTKKFMTAKAAKEEEIKETANWPDFNIRSLQQVREYLFGMKYNGKRNEYGKPIRVRPEGAKSLKLKPLLDTAKPPRRWTDLEERGLDRDATPGTGKMILGILAQENMHRADEINMIRDHRFLDQVLKSILRPPLTDENDQFIENEDGFFEYDKGLAAAIDDDGRVRTHIYATAETGRCKHSRPNLANISKSRDDDYVRMLGGHQNEKGKWVGGEYTHKLRSVLQASPGWALLEFDYMGAELYGMAIMAGSKLMQEHCQRALLDDFGYDLTGQKVAGGKFAHPNYYDIHSNVAVMAFKLKCPPTKHGLDGIGMTKFRTLAKNVIFGIAYGRGAKAIALAARENKIHVTVEEAQKVIDAIFALYPELVPFFNEAKKRAVEQRWLCHCFGRYRRFPSVDDYKMEGEFERQAMNFPIQGMIASAVDRGMAFLHHAIYDQGLQNDMRMLLQIHDAGLIEVKPHLIYHAKKLIKWAMIDMVPIWPTDLAGKTRGDGPYRLGLDFGIYDRWGEAFSLENAKRIGLPLEFAKAA